IPHRLDAGRSRQTVDHRQFADDGARAEDGEDAVFTGRRSDTDSKHSPSEPVAAVSRVAALEQHLAPAQAYRLLPLQLACKPGRQPAQQTLRDDILLSGLQNGGGSFVASGTA